jgi:hypothetical protein
MRGILLVSFVALFLVCVGSSRAADGLVQEPGPGGKIFPKNWVSGFVDFAVAPPHNEPNLNRCSSAAGASGDAATGCAAFARYVGSSYVEFRPFGAGLAHRIFVFVEPHAYLGRNVPQVYYTNAMNPIALERTEGFGVTVSHNLEFRVTNHRVDWLGHYTGNLGTADLGKDGPLSVYTAVSARWYFGGYRRRDREY